MTADTNKPAVRNWWKWFDPRARDAGTWAFILNRITALGLTLYLFMHLVVLGTLTNGEQAWEEFLKLANNPLVVIGELLVVTAGIYHGLNGIRIGIATFGKAAPQQKYIFYAVLLVTVIGAAIFGIRMFSH